MGVLTCVGPTVAVPCPAVCAAAAAAAALSAICCCWMTSCHCWASCSDWTSLPVACQLSFQRCQPLLHPYCLLPSCFSWPSCSSLNSRTTLLETALERSPTPSSRREFLSQSSPGVLLHSFLLSLSFSHLPQGYQQMNVLTAELPTNTVGLPAGWIFPTTAGLTAGGSLDKSPNNYLRPLALLPQMLYVHLLFLKPAILSLHPSQYKQCQSWVKNRETFTLSLYKYIYIYIYIYMHSSPRAAEKENNPLLPCCCKSAIVGLIHIPWHTSGVHSPGLNQGTLLQPTLFASLLHLQVGTPYHECCDKP